MKTKAGIEPNALILLGFGVFNIKENPQNCAAKVCSTWTYAKRLYRYFSNSSKKRMIFRSKIID